MRPGRAHGKRGRCARGDRTIGPGFHLGWLWHTKTAGVGEALQISVAPRRGPDSGFRLRRKCGNEAGRTGLDAAAGIDVDLPALLRTAAPGSALLEIQFPVPLVFVLGQPGRQSVGTVKVIALNFRNSAGMAS